jgi:hypothetical protein
MATIDHVILKVNDLAASVSFYTAYWDSQKKERTGRSPFSRQVLIFSFSWRLGVRPDSSTTHSRSKSLSSKRYLPESKRRTLPTGQRSILWGATPVPARSRVREVLRERCTSTTRTSTYSRSERMRPSQPAWLENVLRHHRGTEPPARDGQVDAAKVTRCYEWKQWGSKGYRELRRRGVSVREAWNVSKSAHGPWRISKSPALSLALPTRLFSAMGLPQLAPARARAACIQRNESPCT